MKAQRAVTDINIEGRYRMTIQAGQLACWSIPVDSHFRTRYVPARLSKLSRRKLSTIPRRNLITTEGGLWDYLLPLSFRLRSGRCH